MVIMTCDKCGKTMEERPHQIIFNRKALNDDGTVNNEVWGNEWYDVCEDCFKELYSAVMDKMEPKEVEEETQPVRKPDYTHMVSHQKGQRYSL